MCPKENINGKNEDESEERIHKAANSYKLCQWVYKFDKFQIKWTLLVRVALPW